MKETPTYGRMQCTPPIDIYIYIYYSWNTIWYCIREVKSISPASNDVKAIRCSHIRALVCSHFLALCCCCCVCCYAQNSIYQFIKQKRIARRGKGRKANEFSFFLLFFATFPLPTLTRSLTVNASFIRFRLFANTFSSHILSGRDLDNSTSIVKYAKNCSIRTSERAACVCVCAWAIRYHQHHHLSGTSWRGKNKK